MAWQQMPFFNFPHYKNMESPTFHSNQSKGLIVMKKICKGFYDLYFYKVSAS